MFAYTSQLVTAYLVRGRQPTIWKYVFEKIGLNRVGQMYSKFRKIGKNRLTLQKHIFRSEEVMENLILDSESSFFSLSE